MENDYYSLEAILSEEERVPTTILFDMYEMGYLDAGSLEKDLKKDTKLDLPFWLAKVLFARNLAQASTPKSFSPKVLGNLKAEAMAVSLGHYPHFYLIGLELVDFLPSPENEKLYNALTDALNERYKHILDKCMNMRNTDLSLFTRRLTLNEKKLFESGYHGAVEYEEWKNTRVGHITISPVLALHRTIAKGNTLLAHANKRRRDE